MLSESLLCLGRWEVLVSLADDMSTISKAVLGISVLLSGGTVVGVHMQERRLRERLREGVVRDLERQNRKQENSRLLEEQIALTKQLEMERSKMLMARESQQ